MNVTVNYLAIVVAAVAGFLLGWGWYMAFSKVWKEALGRQESDCKPTPLPFILAGLGSLLMAWMLAGLMGHLANVTVRGGLITAFFMWAGFVLTTTVVNQQFQGTKPLVTIIDAGHWLAVLLLMGAIIGAFGT